MLFSGHDNPPEHVHYKVLSVSQTTTSVALPYELENELIGRFIRSLHSEVGATTTDDPPSSSSPFLSIVTRTLGQRLDTLRDVFLCLSGQSCTDFELLVVGHRLTKEAEHAVRSVIHENPEWLKRQTRFLSVDHGTRSAPLNAAFRAAQGSYVAVLDDDDLIMGHWVEEFRALAEIVQRRSLTLRHGLSKIR